MPDLVCLDEGNADAEMPDQIELDDNGCTMPGRLSWERRGPLVNLMKQHHC